MTDIAIDLRTFAAARRTWTRADSHPVVRTLVDLLAVPAVLDDDAGEDWAIIGAGDDTEAFVSMLGPLVVALDRVSGPIRHRLGEAVAVISVPGMDAPVLQCPRGVLEAAFGARARSAALDAERFSARELWFATV